MPFARVAVALRELFHICYWLAHTYAKGAKPDPAAEILAAGAAEEDGRFRGDARAIAGGSAEVRRYGESARK